MFYRGLKYGLIISIGLWIIIGLAVSAFAKDKIITVTVDEAVWANYCKWAEGKVAPKVEIIDEKEVSTPLAGNDAGLAFLEDQMERFDRAQQAQDQPPTITDKTAFKEKSVKDVQ